MTPPEVLSPSVSGVTSKSRRSCSWSESSSTMIAACTVAPYATASSGLMLLHGSLSKSSVSIAWIFGMRVEPPTSTTSWTSAASTSASLRTLETSSMHWCSRPRVGAWEKIDQRVWMCGWICAGVERKFPREREVNVECTIQSYILYRTLRLRLRLHPRLRSSRERHLVEVVHVHLLEQCPRHSRAEVDVVVDLVDLDVRLGGGRECPLGPLA
mmetsp:Transcript_16105/g.37526  ORF Transcript_16105/g.37526 Transcript_16105/m.37526 type:complete len:213 (-) Transcript_16105:874-1512(-)